MTTAGNIQNQSSQEDENDDAEGNAHGELSAPPSLLPRGEQKRRRYLLQTIFLVLGIGILVPWNAFISAKRYFYARLCGETIDDQIESIFSVLYNVASVGCLSIMLLVQWVLVKV